MAESSRKNKRTTVIVLGSALLLLFLLLGALNAFNVQSFRPLSTAAIFLFTALTVVVFLLFIMLLILLLRNILKMFADERSRVLGSRLRSRMLIGALLLSLTPALFMFLFSFLLMNRSIDRWFSQPRSQLREDSARIALELSHYASANAHSEAEALASSAAVVNNQDDPAALRAALRAHRITLQGGFSIIYGDDGKPLAEYQVPGAAGPVTVRSWLDDRAPVTAPRSEPLATMLLSAGQRNDEPVLYAGDNEYALGSATVPGGGTAVVGLPMPAGLSSTIASIRSGVTQYWVVYHQRRTIRATYLLLLLLLTALVFFASSWLALYLSKQITRPVEALADAMDEIAAGHYHQRVTVMATQELGELMRSFNHMAADLEQSRMLAETSSTQLSAANLALEERRRELERILETIPNGVATLDSERRILQTNQAFLGLLDHLKPGTLTGTVLESVFPAEIAEDLVRLDRRAQRMGIAAAEFEMRTPRGKRSLSATISLIDLRGRRGSILVLEDVTEFLQAQRQVAWKEVAQRVAHEIKNPLTPILLSAERIKRHIDRETPVSPAVIRKCSEVILGSVESLRALVDQFAALAQFPTAQPKPAELNQIVESALLLFHGRLRDIQIEQRLHPHLPPVMADGEALKRAFANLIDNAAEAMQDSLVRVLTVETAPSETPGMAEITFSDTGHGLTDEMRERLFLPYFSTKQRGTGLGLAIAAKIVQDHQGAIRAEKNTPAGARFILELPFAETSDGNGIAVTAALGTTA